ncbi:hypothetical protein Halru_0154 [Halovivax ruber XH-70]|uniref:Uncharacterized protein n=1 Tax=Halovivax ruber (strain DSM 18193 / JCM 13892 / XH-70) TaxID=797302 RepID=L0I9B3_HALRX|nr:hypothetical protein [Halovivax ruber]AGB14806.1 hypothetical protein Halru_0154 [Halovivax ruber XH-70]
MTDETSESTTDDPSLEDRIDALESVLESQRETIEQQADRLEKQRATLERLDGDGPGEVQDELAERPTISRRTALTGIGLAGLAGLGATSASASEAEPSGEIGTETRPLESVYTQQLRGVPDGETPFDLFAGGDRIARFEPNGSESPNLLFGEGTNAYDVDRQGQTISGGRNNVTSGNSSVVGGGSGNEALMHSATVSGGQENVAESTFSTVAGGNSNHATNSGATVGGGSSNVVEGDRAVIGGGSDNSATGTRSAIGGGSNNSANSIGSTIGGGGQNSTSGNYSTVGGGQENEIDGYDATIAGGRLNTVDAPAATVGGGDLNEVTGDRATVSGGQRNIASAFWATIPGGSHARANSSGQFAYANGDFSEPGDAQASMYVLRNETSSDSETVGLFLDHLGEQIVVPGDRSIAFTAQILGRTTAHDASSWCVNGVATNDGSSSTLSTETVSKFDQANLGSVDVGFDDGENLLEFSVTSSGDNFRDTQWVATIRTTETEFANGGS